MVFDSVRGCSVLFGGQTRGIAHWPTLNDTWIYEDHRWSQRRGWFSKCPSIRCGHAMAFDEEMESTVLFGGISPLGNPLGDTWIFDGAGWMKLKCIGPPARRYAAFAYHPRLKGCLLHGGAVDDNGREKFGDSWLFRDGEWLSLGPEFETAARDDHGLAFHHAANAMIMLEGLLHNTRGEIVREVLGMSKTGWRPLPVSPPHPRHQCSPLAYDYNLDGLILHSGEARHAGPQFNRTLLLHLRD